MSRQYKQDRPAPYPEPVRSATQLRSGQMDTFMYARMMVSISRLIRIRTTVGIKIYRTARAVEDPPTISRPMTRRILPLIFINIRCWKRDALIRAAL